MRVVLCALLCLGAQDAQLDDAIARERTRIAAKVPLTEIERKAYAAPSASETKPVAAYRLAVLPCDFSDTKGGRELKDDLEAVTAFYRTMSFKTFTLELSPQKRITLDATRDELAKWGTGNEAEKKLVAGVVGAIENIDGVILVVAGEIGKRGTSLWPHQDSVEIGGRTIGYLIIPEDLGVRWRAIASHEFGHLLELEDKYEPSAGVGKWCLMGTGYLGEPDDKEKKPLPLCAVCRAKLGWLALATVDPRKDASIVIENGGAVRLKLNPDDKEALVLELRGERVLAWHTGGGKAIELTTQLPTGESDRLTPYSRPPLAGRAQGWYTAYVTDVRVEGAKAWIKVGTTAPLTPLEELLKSRVGKTIK